MNNLPPMTLFDYMVSTRENNMLKAFIPYIDRDFQPMLATYIKYTELLATIDLFSKKGRNVFTSNGKSSSFTDIISSMLPYVSEKEREAFETINNIKKAMEMFEMYKDMMSSDMMNTSADFGNMSDINDDDIKNDSRDNSDNENYDNDNSGHDINTGSQTDEATNTEDSNMTDMLTSMLSPEQRLMFEQLSGMMNNK